MIVLVLEENRFLVVPVDAATRSPEKVAVLPIEREVVMVPALMVAVPRVVAPDTPSVLDSVAAPVRVVAPPTVRVPPEIAKFFVPLIVTSPPSVDVPVTARLPVIVAS